MNDIKTAIVTCSDKGSRGEREDKSGPEIERKIKKYGYVVTSYKILPDDKNLLIEEFRRIGDENIANVLFTTGGTGFSKRDVTPEATKAVCQREVPGIPEAIRQYSMQFTKKAMLSRATAGIYNNTLIINLPGSPKAVSESLDAIMEELRHGVEILVGEAAECAR